MSTATASSIITMPKPPTPQQQHSAQRIIERAWRRRRLSEVVKAYIQNGSHSQSIKDMRYLLP
jgi:hypothetical protein